MPGISKKKPRRAIRKSKPQPACQLLRHTVATLAYRAAKALHGAPEAFAEFRASEKTRTPAQIVAHLGDLFDWALSLAKGKHEWHESEPLDWDTGVECFFASLGAFDNYLASDKRLGCPVEKLFQGPVADALTHVGQLAILRRLAGSPIKGENYFRAEIVAGRVGPDQVMPAFEFD
ncbi:MAG TPA: hypothetical protein VGR72_05610 [Candidatus Acidoferrales bacterium]|nr:hypothetical protein [Candidatus Acidoferrales bacterium]